MCDPVSAAASIIALVSFSGSVLAMGYGYLSQVARAPAEVRMLLSEVSTLNTLLDRLQMLSEDDENSNAKSALQSLARLGMFDNCDKLLNTVRTSIEACQKIHGQEVRNLGRMLIWPIKERETKETVRQLVRLRETISAALAVDSAAALRRIEEAERRIDRNVTAMKDAADVQLHQEMQRRVMDWLCPLMIYPEENYDTALAMRQESTGLWFLESRAFKEWKERNNAFFWLHGTAGCGKTILSTTVIEHLNTNFTGPSHATIYFYCDHRNQKTHSFRNFLMTAARQLIRQNLACMNDVEAVFDAKKQDVTRKLMTSEYVELLRTMSLHFDSVFMVVDALDESGEEEPFATGFRELLRPKDGGPRIRLLATSRYELSIERLLLPISSFSLSLKDLVGEDIKAFISTELDERIRLKKINLRDSNLRRQITEALWSQSDGLFLQVKMQLEYISSLMTDKAVKSALSHLPSGLDETYDRAVQQIMKKHPNQVSLVRNILQWLAKSAVLLTLEELAEAVSIQPDDNHLDMDNIVAEPEDLIAMCGSLVNVDRTVDPPLVHLAHFSVEEYLFSSRLAQSPLAYFYMDPMDAELQLAKTCVQYLSFSDFARGAGTVPDGDKCDVSLQLQQYTLLRYVAVYWAEHLKSSKVSASGIRDKFSDRLDWFLEPDKSDGRYKSWESVYHRHCSEYEDFCCSQPPFYHAVVCGLECAFDILLPTFADLNIYFTGGWTPLTAAAQAGQTSMLRRILRAGANPDLPADRHKLKGLTALHIAAEECHGDMVTALLAAGASAHAKSNSLTTPLYRAARGGSLPILHMLRAAGADVDARTWDAWTPLFEAVESDHLPVVRLLLEWGADPAARNRNGETPLSLARRLSRREILAQLEAAVILRDLD